ncbi:unnamed protein product [Rotaria socialis]|uniref:Uncharacterized protein n=1 Tax=Rotaria socialis TaxID=392032 RepID=A0A817ZQJ5_9BILA|nr:unnamed protein product [Rotaria socialis]CAF4429066.1 unnamed protein product [Rotaria socialis]
MALYSQLAKLLYNNQTSSSVQQCFTDSSNLRNCLNGVCSYTWIDVPLIQSFTCDPSTRFVSLSYIQYRVLPPIPVSILKNVFDFKCNLNKCNSPFNVAAVRRAIEASGDMNNNSTPNHRLSIMSLSSLMILLSLLLSFS